jgi:hypothetical protein
MPEYYKPILNEEYDRNELEEQFSLISDSISMPEVPRVHLNPQARAPVRPQEGDVIFADGDNWNPEHGKGTYEYKDSEWVPLFPLSAGAVLARIHVGNTVTETTIYTTTVTADSLRVGEIIKLYVSGYYDTDAASDTFDLKVKFNGTVLHTIARLSGNNASSFGWELIFTAGAAKAGNDFHIDQGYLEYIHS